MFFWDCCGLVAAQVPMEFEKMRGVRRQSNSVAVVRKRQATLNGLRVGMKDLAG